MHVEMNFELNFWEVHPEFKIAGPFKELYKKDRSPKKAKSSKEAWCVKLIWHRKSLFYPLPLEGEGSKTEVVFDNILGDPEYYQKNRAKVDELADYFMEVVDSIAVRSLRGLEEKLKERDAFLKRTPYDMGEIGEKGNWVGGTVDTLDKMMANTDKLYTLLAKARKEVEQEEEQETMGGGEESLSDKGDL